MLTIKNPDKICSKHVKFYRKLANYTIKKYLTASQLKNSCICIHLINGVIEYEYKKEKNVSRGICFSVGENDKFKHNIEVLVSTVDLNKKGKNIFVKLQMPAKTIIHELTHAKQYIKGELKDVKCKNTYKTSWKGEIYSQHSNEIENGKFYDYPWEIEAFGRAECIWQQFIINYNNINGYQTLRKPRINQY